MNLIIALCLLCGCVAPHACRSVDTREPPAQDLEPFVARHHHEGNIAELLIPLLERSLAQSEARSNERHHKRPKPGKKVIQVLPYPGSEEHKRKGWRKLNSHKKQVVEITPLHGKNGAKPLAYILSAAKPSHVEGTLTNDDYVSGSDVEHDKSTSEQQSEEKNVNINILKSAEVSSSALSNSQGYKEYTTYVGAEKARGIKNGETSEEVSTEFRFTRQRGVKSRNHKVTVKNEDKSVTLDVTQEAADDSVSSGDKHKSRKFQLTAENYDLTAESDFTEEDIDSTSEDRDFTSEDRDLTSEKRDLTSEYRDVTSEYRDVTSEDRDFTAENIDFTGESSDFTSEDKDFTSEDRDVTSEYRDVTSEYRDVTSEYRDVTSEYRDVTSENRDVTSEYRDVTSEYKDVTSEYKDVTSENRDVTSENRDVTSEIRDVTSENRDVTSEIRDVTSEIRDVTSEYRDVTSENKDVTSENIDLTAEDLTTELDVTAERDQAKTRDFISDDIVISHHGPTDKKIGKIFDTSARDVIELIQSSVEASTAKHKKCKEHADKHSHDHKSYRLSFLFNK